MRVIHCTTLILVGLVLIAGCRPEQRADILGIDSLALDDEDAIVVTDRTNGPGAGLVLRGPDGETALQVRIEAGKSFQLSDGRHASDTYKLLRIENGQAIIEHKSVFNAKSIDGSVKSERSVIAVRPYPTPQADKASNKTPG